MKIILSHSNTPGLAPGLFIQRTECNEYQHQTENGVSHRYRYVNDVPLNDSHPDFKVNFIEYWEIKKNGETQHFSWITDFTINDNNAYQIMKGGRCNWKIESAPQAHEKEVCNALRACA